MDKEIVHIGKLSDVARQLNVPLSPVVKAGDFVFVSGRSPRNSETGELEGGGIAKETELSLRGIKVSLEAAGSSLDKVVKCVVWITNAAHFDTVNEIYGRYFPTDPPARTFVTVQSFPYPFDIEIECIAIV